jgi:hypothetical protein
MKTALAVAIVLLSASAAVAAPVDEPVPTEQAAPPRTLAEVQAILRGSLPRGTPRTMALRRLEGLGVTATLSGQGPGDEERYSDGLPLSGPLALGIPEAEIILVFRAGRLVRVGVAVAE